MRIALVSEHASPLAVLGEVDAGGQNVHVAALATALAALGHEVVVHTRRDDPDLPDRVEMAPGVVVDHVPAGPARAIPKDDLLPHMARLGAELGRRWSASPPDVVHAHFWMSGVAAQPVASRLGIPFVQTFHALGAVKRRHQGSADTSPAGRLAAEAALARDADRLIATCSDEVFELVRMGAHRRRVSVVPCGVDLARFTPDGPVAPRRPGAARLLSVGRLVERKGVGEVVTALAEVPGAELVVAGGPDRAGLAEDPKHGASPPSPATTGVADRVQLLGRVGRDALPALLRSADAVVCTPWYEPFGIVPLEAMACGIPVVAASVGGLIDTVVDDVNGLRVPPRDHAALVASLRRLLADPALRARLGRGGLSRARSRFGWHRIARATVDAYATLVGTAAARRGPVVTDGTDELVGHLGDSAAAVASLAEHVATLARWGREWAATLTAGSRLLAAGNGGSAAEAQHLTAELVGRYRGERVPLSAWPLHGDGSAVTAIANDYGACEVFARQVRAHGRPGDVLVLLSTSGRSPNLLAAADAGHHAGLRVLGLTGPGPNPLAERCDETVAVASPRPAAVQEAHLVAVHLLCTALDEAVAHGAAAGEMAAVAAGPRR